MNQSLPQKIDRESLSQLSKEELVEIVIQQALALSQLQGSIQELKQEIKELRVSRDLNSKTSSKPSSTDLLKKPEKNQQETELESNSQKRKPGGQPGHQGKTRKGFGRVDRWEILRPEHCTSCGHTAFVTEAVKAEKQQVAQPRVTPDRNSRISASNL